MRSDCKWSKALKMLTYGGVRPWVSQFWKYLSTMDLSDDQAKMIPVQHVEELVLFSLEALVDTRSMGDCLCKLFEVGKPLAGSMLRNLLGIKQKERESVGNFVIRFRNAAVDSKGEEERLKEAFIEALILF